MKKVKGKKAVNDKPDNSGWIGSMKGKIEVKGDIFSTGAWPTDQEILESYNEVTAEKGVANETDGSIEELANGLQDML